MAPFVYRKYTSQLVSFPPSYQLQQTGTGSGAAQSVSGYSSYSFNSSTGVISYVGGISSTTNGTRYSGGSSSVTQMDTSPQGYSFVSYSSVQVSSGGSYYARGTYIEPVIAEDGTYPTNGRHTDGFWYERQFEATAPVVTNPNGGQTYNDEDVLITWTHALTGFTYRVELTLNNGSTWSTLGTTSAKELSYNFATTPDSSLAKIRVTPIKDGLNALSDSSDGVFTIRHNVAPTIPTNLSPASQAVDRTRIVRFSWTHNDTDAQSKADIQYRAQGSSTWTDIVSNGDAREYSFSANTFAIGQIEWRVRTYDTQSLVSPWSNTVVFTAADPSAAPVITSPSTNVSIARPVIQWTSVNQSSYQVIVEDSLGATVWDTGEVNSINKAITSGIDFANGGQYTIRVRIKDNSGLFSSFTSRSVTVSYTPPAQPNVQFAAIREGIRILISNPAPTGTQPLVEGSDILKLIDGEFVRIATNIQSVFTDYEVASEKQYQYRVVSNGENGTNRISDITQVRASRIFGIYLHDVKDPSATLLHLKYISPGRSQNKAREHAFMQFVGREYTSIEYGTMLSNGVNMVVHIKKEDAQAIQRLDDFLQNPSTYYYRDHRGRSFATAVTELPSTDVFYGETINLTFQQIDYQEEV